MNDTKPLLIETHDDHQKKPKSRSKKWIIISFVVLLSLVGIGLLIYFVTLSEDESISRSNEYFEQQFLKIPSNDSCYNYSQNLANEAHIAGEPQTFILGDIFANYLDNLGYEPYRDNINPVVLDHYVYTTLLINNIPMDIANEIIPGEPDTNNSYRYAAWNAFSSSGNYSGQLLYVNDASRESFEYLRINLSIDFSENNNFIALAKRGNRGNQVNTAANYNISSLILFENQFIVPNEQFPNAPGKLPDSGFMYGTIAYWGGAGCPGNTHPDRLERECGYNISNWFDLYPALKHNISVISLSSKNAISLFELMNTPQNINNTQCNAVNNLPNWQTDLNLPDGITVCVGGTDDIIANLNVKNNFQMNDTIQNVYAYFEGGLFPDEIIMVGAHRDSWGLGACDDISGTVTILEIARSLSVLRDKYGWKPKRSLLFGSWDGEEWGLYGSVDFNENTNPWIDKVVTYLNFDMTVTGGGLYLEGNPLLRTLLLNTAKMIKYPYQNLTQFNRNNNKTESGEEFTLFDTWWNFESGAANDLFLTPMDTDLGPFEYYSGIPCTNQLFWQEDLAYTYHTFYDLNGWLDVVDPKWDYAQFIAQFGGLLMLKLSQQSILPFDVKRFADKLIEWIQDLITYAAEQDCDIGNYIDDLIDATSYFQNNTNLFVNYIENNFSEESSLEDTEEIKKINNILKNIMKRLTLPSDQGLPSNKWYKQIIYTPWGSTVYPYIWDTIDPSIGSCNTESLEEAFDLTVVMINNAADLLLMF